MMFRSRVYTSSPLWVQELLISCRAKARMALREGQSYNGFLSRAREREHWSADDLQAYQARRLRDLLEHASRSVPYYSGLFARYGFRPRDSSLPRSLCPLPILTKRDIVAAGDALLANRRRLVRVKGSTGGTTGTPVTIYQDLRAISRENAFMMRQLVWAGFSRGNRRAWIRGDMIVPADNEAAPHWRMNRAENMLMMSSYHLSESSAPKYISALRSYSPRLIQAYPSAISYLARYLRARGRFYESPDLQAIVTSSETLSAHDRQVTEERFGCKVFDWYGTFERVAAIGTCESGSYHLLTDYSHVEFERTEDGLFEIIGTGFNNLLMPLVRFRTGDLVELPDKPTNCACGRAFPVITGVHGRTDDYIKLSDGRRIARLGHIFKGVDGIAEAQIIQDELDSIRILVVPFESFPSGSQKVLIDNARQRLGASAQVYVEVVSSIERTRSGKLRSIVCNV